MSIGFGGHLFPQQFVVDVTAVVDILLPLDGAAQVHRVVHNLLATSVFTDPTQSWRQQPEADQSDDAQQGGGRHRSVVGAN